VAGGEGARTGALRVRRLADVAPPPVYVVDGRVLSPAGGPPGEGPAGLPAPDAIARVDVLKGDAATAAYGAAGRHGVVQITTLAGARRP
jgi:TonB-dependent SusC/RagA subfamily outer membrane receptor